jgi:hypothetical protein
MNYFDQICSIGDENIIALLSGASNEDLQKALFKNNVEIINLEMSYQCNRKCDYCPVSTSNRQDVQKTISNKLVQKIVDELSQIRYENRISLNLYNEPLLDASLEEKISIFREKLPFANISFNSNGDKLNYNRLVALSDAGLDYICVTLHPQPNQVDSSDTLLRRINKLASKTKFSGSTEVDLTIGFLEFRSHGVRIRIQWPDWRKNGSNRGGVVKKLTDHDWVRSAPCVKPFREFTVFHDGIVQPCCEAFHDDLTNLVEIADLNKSSIFEAYSNERIAQFRQSVFSFSNKKGICAGCNSADYSSRAKDKPGRDRLLNIVTGNNATP